MKDDVIPLHRGSRTTCFACGYQSHGSFFDYTGLASAKVHTWVHWLFGCREKREHLHQKCNECGSRWIVGYADGREE